MINIIFRNVIDVTENMIILESPKKRVPIYFSDCVKNYSLENGNNFRKCVATRDITKLTFTFYTQPKTKVVFKKSFLNNLITGKSAQRKFFDLQKLIAEAGYTSYDLS